MVSSFISVIAIFSSATIQRLSGKLLIILPYLLQTISQEWNPLQLYFALTHFEILSS